LVPGRSNENLSQIQAGPATGDILPYPLNGWQEKGDQDGEERDDHEQLDESETRSAAVRSLAQIRARC
jgi:hypothetical protein